MRRRLLVQMDSLVVVAAVSIFANLLLIQTSFAADTTPAKGKIASPPSSSSNDASKDLKVARTIKPVKAGAKAPMKSSSMKPKFEIGGSMQAGGRFTFNQPDVLRLGESDGFYVRRARITLRGNAGPILGELSVDGAFDNLAGPLTVSPSTRELQVALRDAFIGYGKKKGFFIAIGQMRVPFGVHVDRSTMGEHFIMFPLMVVGENISFGYNAPRIFPGRDIGLNLGYKMLSEGFELTAQAMVYNGNGGNRFGNDSDLPAAALRVNAKISNMIKVGLSGLINPRRAGDVPLLYDETDMAFSFDAGLEVSGFFLEIQAAMMMTSFPSTGQETVTRLGGVLDAGYQIPFMQGTLEIIVRGEYYDPSDQFDDDHLLYITAGVNWFYYVYKEQRLGLRLNYTHKMELAESRALNNDQINLMVGYQL